MLEFSLAVRMGKDKQLEAEKVFLTLIAAVGEHLDEHPTLEEARLNQGILEQEGTGFEADTVEGQRSEPQY